MANDYKRGIISWFARNGVAANLLMGVIGISGLLSLATIRTQAMPDQVSDSIMVDVAYPGASPKEVESGIILKIEEVLKELQGISELQSTASEGFGRVVLDVDSDFEVGTVLDDVKLAVDRVHSFPGEIERPRIYRSEVRSQVIYVQVFGNLDEKALKQLAIKVRSEIQDLPHVTATNILGAKPYEISIELSREVLQHYNLSMTQVADAIRRSSLDLPAGSIKTASGDILLRTQGQAYVQEDFERIPLLTSADGTSLSLGDVANIEDGFAEIESTLDFDGKPSISIGVFAVGKQNSLTIASEVKEYVAARQHTLPDGVHLDAWLDSTFYLDSTLEMMMGNLLTGILSVFIVLSIFLRIQLAFWVIVGLPICFLGTFALLPFSDVSLNIMSLFGFILVLGIVVDDAIIIGESAQSMVEEEGHSTASIVRGAKKVAVPATFGVLTTIVAFVPMLTAEGPGSNNTIAIGTVVALCLVFSLIESKLILPAHLAHMKPLPKLHPSQMDPIRRGQDRFSAGFREFVTRYYEPTLTFAIRHRYSTVALFLAVLIASVGLIASPLVRVVLFPELPSDYMVAFVDVVEGSPSSQTAKIVKELGREVRAMNEEYDENDRFLNHMIEVVGDENGQIWIELSKGEDREVNAIQLADDWRARMGDIAGLKRLQVVGSTRMGGGTTFTFELQGRNAMQLEGAAAALQQKLRSYAGVYDIESTLSGRAKEVEFSLTPAGTILGLTLQDLAYQVRAAFYGIEAQRIQRGAEELKVMVRYPLEQRVSLGNLETMYIRTPEGAEVPFGDVATVSFKDSAASITRSNGKQAAIVTANAVTSQVEPGPVVAAITAWFNDELKARYPEVDLVLGGASAQQMQSLERLMTTALLALFGIYALMAIPLRSYLQPLIIMGVIPFGMIGALIGHIVVGISFSLLSVFGIVALAGVVVNDSIIMVDHVNRAVDEGSDLESAAVSAGMQRFRAILLTSLTTFFGLLPMLLERSLAAQVVLPMAVSLGFGILFATVITLVLIPCLYVILVDVDRSRSFTQHTYQQILGSAPGTVLKLARIGRQ